jgi:hypothetical protein
MPSSIQGRRYQPQYDENLRAVETILRLIDAILEDRSPLLGLERDAAKHIQHLRDAKVTLSILAHFLRKGTKEERGG